MEFNWRLEDKSNYYSTLVSWWEAHKAFNGKIIEYDRMPNRVFIVSKENEDLIAVSVYISDSTVCWIGWITSNPDARLKSKFGALDYINNIIGIVMKSQGFTCIISKTNDRSLIKSLDKNGFVITEKSNFYIKNL